MTPAELSSIAYRTDILFPAFDGVIEDRGSHLVVRTPNNPGFFWGNFLLFSSAPRAGDEAKWPALFAEAFGSDSPHIAFGWDEDSRGESARFEEAGFRLEESSVLVTDSLHAPTATRPPIIVRSLSSPQEWELARAVYIEGLCTGKYRDDQVLFMNRLFDRYEKMNARDLGRWYGAFDHQGAFLGGMGIFHDAKFARFQEVFVHASHRRQGICRHLVYESCKLHYASFRSEVFVTVADAQGPALSSYLDVGFKIEQTQRGLCWYDRTRWP